jgi:hypothetical protein
VKAGDGKSSTARDGNQDPDDKSKALEMTIGYLLKSKFSQQKM